MFTKSEYRSVSGIPSSSFHEDSDAADTVAPVEVLQALARVVVGQVACKESGAVFDQFERPARRHPAARYAGFLPFAIPFLVAVCVGASEPRRLTGVVFPGAKNSIFGECAPVAWFLLAKLLSDKLRNCKTYFLQLLRFLNCP